MLFLEDVPLDRMLMTELCAHYHISRKTGDTWFEREAEEGLRSHADEPRAES